MAEKLAIVDGDRIVPEDFIKPWPYLTEDDREQKMTGELFKRFWLLRGLQSSNAYRPKDWPRSGQNTWALNTVFRSIVELQPCICA